MTAETLFQRPAEVFGRKAHSETVKVGRVEPTVHYICDSSARRTYVRGKLLGKGGFARCYEVTETTTNMQYACKVIPKTRVAKPHQREKIEREITLHMQLKNAYVVELISYFEDHENIYLILEYCKQKSLMELLKERGTLPEAEVRFLLRQMIHGVRYLHANLVIHRDLKLGNLLLTADNRIKIADFGLATQLSTPHEKKATVCGTPNYIAPEVLQKRGYGFKVDTWALGCVVYAMLIGTPPFETSSLKETYARIASCSYQLPGSISKAARHFIDCCLQPDPESRPSLEQLLNHEFLRSAAPNPCTAHVVQVSQTCHPAHVTATPHVNVAQTAYITCLPPPSYENFISMKANARPKSYAAEESFDETQREKYANGPPPYSVATKQNRREVTRRRRYRHRDKLTSDKQTAESVDSDAPHVYDSVPSSSEAAREDTGYFSGCASRPPSRRSSAPSGCTSTGLSSDGDLADETKDEITTATNMCQLLDVCLRHMNPVHVQTVKAQLIEPLLWITKWVDYSNKYGFGFQLSDETVSVLFNDDTRLCLNAYNRYFYFESQQTQQFNGDDVPQHLRDKSELLQYFSTYMRHNLISSGQSQHTSDSPVYMTRWIRNNQAILMLLSNGTVQVNFFGDHTKVVISKQQSQYIVTMVDPQRNMSHFRLLEIQRCGCSPDVTSRLTQVLHLLRSVVAEL